MKNIDPNTVFPFFDEWSRFDQDGLHTTEYQFLFKTQFCIFPSERLPDNAHGFDMGCGSGGWAILVAPTVGALTYIDSSPDALIVTQRKLSHLSNVRFVNASVSDQALPPESQDFGYSLGLLQHVPHTILALRDWTEFMAPMPLMTNAAEVNRDANRSRETGLATVAQLLRDVIDKGKSR